MAGRGRGRPVPAWMQKMGDAGNAPAPGGSRGPPPPPPRQQQQPQPGGLGRGGPVNMTAPPARGGAAPAWRGAPGPTSGYPPQTQPAYAPQHATSLGQPPQRAVNMPPPCDWTEHTAPDGRKYYYNAKDGKSVWVKPEELTKYEQAVAAAQAPPTTVTPTPTPTATTTTTTTTTTATTSAGVSGGSAGAAVASADSETAPEDQIPKPVWQEHTADTGQKYYYNPETKKSVWKMPPEYREYLDAVEAAKSPVDPKEQKKNAFLALLKEKNISHLMTYEELSDVMAHEARFRTLPPREKRALFDEYKGTAKIEAARAEKRKDVQIRKEFEEMVIEWGKATQETRFAEVADALKSDPRWGAVKDDTTREDYFVEVLYRIGREEKDRLSRERVRWTRESEAFMDKLIEEGKLTVQTLWADAEVLMEGCDSFFSLPPVDQLYVFENKVNELYKKSRDARTEASLADRKVYRQNRADFKAFLEAAVASGHITIASTWPEFLATHLVSDDGTLHELVKRMAATPGSTPEELFNDIIDDMELVLVDDVRALTSALRRERAYGDLDADASDAELRAALEKKFPSETEVFTDDTWPIVCEEVRHAKSNTVESTRDMSEGEVSGSGSGSSRGRSRRRHRRRKHKSKRRRDDDDSGDERESKRRRRKHKRRTDSRSRSRSR